MAWAILLIILLLGIYTLFIIKKEQNSFLKDARVFPIRHYKIYTANWWGVDAKGPNSDFIRFKRLDTDYDWHAYFCWKNQSEKKLEKILDNYLSEQNIIFDEDQKIITNSLGLIKDPTLASSITEFFRMEGTATQNQEQRLYLDLCLIKDKRFEGYFFAESKSAILNGSVEGPFFEKTLKHLKTN